MTTEERLVPCAPEQLSLDVAPVEGVDLPMGQAVHAGVGFEASPPVE